MTAHSTLQTFLLFLYLHSLKLSEFLKRSSFDHTYLIVLQMSVGEKKELHYPINSSDSTSSDIDQPLWVIEMTVERGPHDFALSQQWLISKQPFSHENQNRFLSDFMKCAVASADPHSCPACSWRRSGGYFQSSPLLWRLCHISGPLKFSRCFTKTAHLHGYFLFIFESLWIRTTRRHTHRTHTATKLYSAPDNTSNPPKRETIPKQKTS